MSTHEHRDQHGNPDDLKEYISRLDDPARDEWQRPDVVLATLGITRTSVVGEIGTGTGYFALRLAKLAAWVYAIDVEPQLLWFAVELCTYVHYLSWRHVFPRLQRDPREGFRRGGYASAPRLDQRT